ncbi:hypothetical protein GCM10011610_59500 [Nocardia rhizosphaerihabitans]|uniref:Uncharacterized protein n=1 Tax=Nocardia rhizosphaerihabitans TaxID=1691570 RepID=A0ABQ2KYT7_9NOCA|nr:hypothetical protein GCM10011610_59500 [Nocardia rhizosphaerihabitans]
MRRQRRRAGPAPVALTRIDAVSTAISTDGGSGYGPLFVTADIVLHRSLPSSVTVVVVSIAGV